jgi:hypothetical protein
MKEMWEIYVHKKQKKGSRHNNRQLHEVLQNPKCENDLKQIWMETLPNLQESRQEIQCPRWGQTDAA